MPNARVGLIINSLLIAVAALTRFKPVFPCYTPWKSQKTIFAKTLHHKCLTGLQMGQGIQEWTKIVEHNL